MDDEKNVNQEGESTPENEEVKAPEGDSSSEAEADARADAEADSSGDDSEGDSEKSEGEEEAA